MLRFRKLFLLFFIASCLNFAVPCPSFAHPTPTYDLESLCYMSQDVVEARLTRHHVQGQEEWKDTFTAIVTHPIAGSRKTGDKISRLDLTAYDPAETGQRCILFLADKQFSVEWQPAESIPVQVTDMLLVDKHSRVRRYFQWMNPGGLLAQGYSPFPPIHLELETKPKKGSAVTASGRGTEDDSSERSYPTDTKECQIIALKWIATDQLRPLLSRNPRPADFPVLLKLLSERRATYAHQRDGPSMKDIISPSLCQRFTGSQIGWAYVRSVSQDRKQPTALRSAADEVLRLSPRFFPLPIAGE